MKPTDALLAEIHGSTLFPFFKKEMQDSTPPRAEWRANSDKEELIYAQGLRDGYLLALQKLKLISSEET